MTFASVKSKVHLFTDDTVIYLVLIAFDYGKISSVWKLEIGLKCGFQWPSNAVLVTRREKENPLVHMQGINRLNSGILAFFTLEQ